MKAGKARLISLFTTFILGLSILLLAACVIAAAMGGDNPYNAHLFGIKPVYVSTSAMEPAIKENSIVLSRKTGFGDISEGDIVLRIYNGGTVIRRVVRKTPKGSLITKADNRFFEDATPLDEGNFIAVILFR